MDNFGQAMPVSAVPLLKTLLQRQQVYACMFHKLLTKINGTFLYI